MSIKRKLFPPLNYIRDFGHIALKKTLSLAFRQEIKLMNMVLELYSP